MIVTKYSLWDWQAMVTRVKMNPQAPPDTRQPPELDGDIKVKNEQLRKLHWN